MCPDHVRAPGASPVVIVSLPDSSPPPDASEQRPCGIFVFSPPPCLFRLTGMAIEAPVVHVIAP
jgi:hypothetical protein